MSLRAAPTVRPVLALLLISLLLPTFPLALAEPAAPETPIYEAYARTTFQLRTEADAAARRIHKVDNRDEVDVLQYGEEWCKILVEREFTGFAKTEWLWRFRSYDPSAAPNIPMLNIVGVATVVTPFTVSVNQYAGNTMAAGDRFAVSGIDRNAVLFPMMRDTAAAAPDAVSITPVAPYQSAQPGDLLSAFTTFYNDTTGGALAQERAYNIRLGCERINGIQIASGETFSFNAVCAPYRKSNGYQMAPNISADGKGYGGGVCQVSTTMYNALLTLPLRITKWAIHRDSGVPYIPVGFDSAVGSYSDLSFINTLPYPLRVEAVPQNGVLTVLIYRV